MSAAPITRDAENRLAAIQSLVNVPDGAKLRPEFAYDYMGRRIQKKVYGWDGATGSCQLASVSKFVYDGRNLAAEMDGSNALVRSYVLGQDMSNSLRGAGGVGGLLLISDSGNFYQIGYDGNGNVASLVSAMTGLISASYEYDPYGSILKAVGHYAATNPWKFSTKYEDDETKLLYYGYRYYDPQKGRWISKDPSGEYGGVNLYNFVGNNPISSIDQLGLYTIDVHYYLTYWLALRTNCYTDAEARLVANSTQHTDEDPRTRPELGRQWPNLFL